MTRSLLALILTAFLPNVTHAAMPPAASYLCYKAGLAPGQAKLPAAQTRLEDRFGSLTADVKSVQSVCNPTETAPHPAVHGVGYKIVGAKKPPQPPFVKTPVTTVDQFASHRLVLVKPVDLLTPSALALGADGVAPATRPESITSSATRPRGRRARRSSSLRRRWSSPTRSARCRSC